MELADAILLLRDPNVTEGGLILAAKLAARELGPVLSSPRLDHLVADAIQAAIGDGVGT